VGTAGSKRGYFLVLRLTLFCRNIILKARTNLTFIKLKAIAGEISMTVPKSPAANEVKYPEKDPETNRRILKVAERLFLAKGFKGVSMKDIAEDVQVTAAALYYHFPHGKQELFVSMLKQIIVDLNEENARIIRQTEGGIRAKLIASATFFFTRPMTSYISLWRDLEEFLRDKSIKKDLMQYRRQDVLLMATVFQQAIDAGEIADTVSAAAYAVMYSGMIMGLQMGRDQGLFHDEQAKDNARLLAETAVVSLLDGIGKI
jgi:AcrR family transcriptional regulator